MCAACKYNKQNVFPFSSLSDDDFVEEYRTTGSLNFGAKLLNHLFSTTSDDDDVFDSVSLSNNDMKEPYLETNLTHFLYDNESFLNTLLIST